MRVLNIYMCVCVCVCVCVLQDVSIFLADWSETTLLGWLHRVVIPSHWVRNSRSSGISCAISCFGVRLASVVPFHVSELASVRTFVWAANSDGVDVQVWLELSYATRREE